MNGIVLLMDERGRLMEQQYHFVDHYIRAGYVVLPYRLQPKGFNRVEFEHYLKDNTYLMWEWSVWLRLIQVPRDAPTAGSTTYLSKAFIKRVEKFSPLDSIWLRPLLFGCSIKELVLSMIVPVLVSVASAYVTSQLTISTFLKTTQK